MGTGTHKVREGPRLDWRIRPDRADPQPNRPPRTCRLIAACGCAQFPINNGYWFVEPMSGIATVGELFRPAADDTLARRGVKSKN
jgi:hypothetical protein